MNHRLRTALVQIATILAATTIGFVALQLPFRRAEAWSAAHLLQLDGARHVSLATSTSIVVFPSHGPAFRALVTPSCSAVSSVLALVCLGWAASTRRRARRLRAVAAAVLTVAVGNVLRIAGSLAVGIMAGRVALVLFHDWIGSVFAFGYTLGGYVLLLYLILDDHVPLETTDANAR